MDPHYFILGNGWLGNRLKEYLGNESQIIDKHFYPYDVSGLLIKSGVLINTISKTNIDWCEKNKFETLEINSILAYHLAKYAKENELKYVFFSSACVFESKDEKDIKYEDSIPNPQCWYAWTKVIAEQLVLEVNSEALIIRLRLPISAIPHPRNTIDKLLNYDKINTNQESITVIEDMFPMLQKLIQENEKGIFHLINGSTISPAQIADLFHHPHKKVSKESQDQRLAEEGRAKRVTAYIGSKRIPLLPNIWDRLPDVINEYTKRKNQ